MDHNEEEDKENLMASSARPSASQSLAKKMVRMAESVDAMLSDSNNQFSDKVEASVETNLQSCYELMSTTQKLLLISSSSSSNKLAQSPSVSVQHRQTSNKPTNSSIMKKPQAAQPLGKVDVNDKAAVPIKRENSELENALLVNFMQNDEASVLSRRMSSSKEEDEEQEHGDKHLLAKLMESSSSGDDDDDDIEFLQQAQNFENSLLAGRDDSKGNSPVAAAEAAQSSAQESKEEPCGPAVEDVPEVEVEEEDEDQESEENQKYIKVLKHYFGYSRFRGLQLKVIKTLIEEKRDQLVVMATGQGKSLCYQFPALFLKGIAVVISPLISLMEDQVMALKLVNVEACLLGSAQDNQAEIYDKIYSGQCRILYITPEFIDTAKELLESIQQKVGISLLAIDECHCVSQWGNDFRPAYRKVGSRFRELLKDTPFIALTATATPVVRRDILKSLYLHNPLVTVTSFDRPNLYLSVSSKGVSLRSDLIKMMTETTIKGTDGAGQSNGVMTRKTHKFDGPTIIYCQTRDMTGKIADELRALGIKCDKYHGGMTLPDRKRAQVQFINDQVDVMVATVAFGMGIDKPDIRAIIHYGIPANIESYYQEIGRAGRDGLPSKCHVFYATADYSTAQFLINECKEPSQREHKNRMFALTKNFVSTTSCRRHFILNFFEDVSVKKGSCQANKFRANCCDNCTMRLANAESNNGNSSTSTAGSGGPEMKDLSAEARLLFRTVTHLNERFGLAMVVGYLIGSKAQKVVKITEYISSTNGLYGAGRSKSEAWWKAFAQQLTNENYLDAKVIQGGFGSTVILTPKARTFLADKTNSCPVLLFETTQMRELSAPVVKPSYSITVSSPHTKSSKPPANIILPLVPVRELASICQWSSSSAASTSSSSSSGQQAAVTEVDDEQFKETELFKVLLNVRNEIATESGVSAHRICSNKILSAFAHIRPSVIENLKLVEGFPQANLSTGQRIIDKIASFCSKYKLKTDNRSSLMANATLDMSLNTATASMNSLSSKMEQLLMNLSETKRTTYLAYQIEQRALDEIALKRGLAHSTLTGHLEEALLIGLPLDMGRLGLTMEAVNKLEARIRQPPINSNVSKLTVIKEQVPDISWENLRLMVAILKIKYGANADEDEIPASSGGSSQQKLTIVQQGGGPPAPAPDKKDETTETGAKSSKHLPEWLKRPPSDPDLKTLAERPPVSSQSSSNPKKKPKFGI